MAKKSIATFQAGSKKLTKAVKMVKSEKSGSYTFVEKMVTPDKVNDFFKEK